MIKTTAAYKEAVKKNRIFHHKVIINFKDGNTTTVEDMDIYSLQIADATSNTSSFDVGTTIAQQLTLKLNNIDGRFDKHDFNGAEIAVKVGLEINEKSIEWLDKGIYIAEPGEESGNTISVNAFDYMAKFDQPYSLSKLSYPASLGSIVRDACSSCGVTLAPDTATFDNDSYVVQKRPDDSALTFRQVLKMVGEIACKFFRINTIGKLSARWYNTEILESAWVRKEDTIWLDSAGDPIADSAGQEIGLVIEDLIKAGNTNVVDVDDTQNGIIKISSFLSGSTFLTDDLVITGVRIIEEKDNEETAYQYGSDGYVLEISDNKLIQDGSGATVSAYLGEHLNGLQFRPLSVSVPADPSREAGDLGLVVDTRGRYHKTIFTNVDYTAHAAQSLVSGAEAPTRLSSTRYSQATQVYKELRANIKKQKKEWDKAFDDLQIAMGTKNGLFPIDETMEDGSTILYFCDKPTLVDSSIVVKFSAAGWAMSTDGCNTWNSGWLVDGTMIAKILNVIGINAKWINSGAITVKDDDGNILFSVDMDTKKVIISGDNIIIGDSPLSNKLTNMDNEIAQSKNMSMQLSNEMQSITADAEGNIAVFPQVSTKATVMYGSNDITNDCSFTVTKSAAVTGSWDKSTHTYTVTGLNADDGWVDIKAVYLVNLVVTKRFTISKQKQGKQGIQGVGKDGKTTYLHIRYAPVQNPTASQMTKVPDSNTVYIGTYSDFDGKPSTNPSDYTWAKFKGDTGAKGTDGKDGKPTYTWMKYACSPDGADMSDSPDYVKLLDSNGNPILDSTGAQIYTVTQATYIGLAQNKDTPTESDNPKDYIWSKFRGDDGINGTDGIDGKDGINGTPGRVYSVRGSADILLMGKDKKVTPEKLYVYAYYHDGEGAEQSLPVWWKGEMSTDAGATWSSFNFTQDKPVSSCVVTSMLQTLGPKGMLKIYAYLDKEKTRLAGMQSFSVVLDVASLTQTEIVEILSDNAKWKGLYYKNGQLYISFSAALGGELTLGGVNNDNGVQKIRDKNGKLVSEISNAGQIFYDTNELVTGVLLNDKLFFFDKSIALSNTEVNVTGATFYAGGIGRFTGTIQKSESGTIFANSNVSYVTDDGEFIPPLWFSKKDPNILNGEFDRLIVEDFLAEDGFIGAPSFGEPPEIIRWQYATASDKVGWRLSDHKLILISSSSKRYKDLGDNITSEELENWYNIEPLWAKYKDGYLAEGDENEGRYIPMFIAEDVEEYFPEATRHADGLVEDWNERIMIPAMFAMIKSQKEQLDRQEKLINQLYEKLNIEKK